MLNPSEARLLWEYIKAHAPRLSPNAIYTRDDLVSQVYLEAHQRGLGLEDLGEVSKLIRNFSISQYRPKYATHRTANYSAEELLEYCAGRVVLPEEPVISPLALGVFDGLRAAFLSREETSFIFGTAIQNASKPHNTEFAP